MKLWDKGVSIDKTIEAFTVGDDRDISINIIIFVHRISNNLQIIIITTINSIVIFPVIVPEFTLTI